jgi:signal transduction histidine kinase
MHIIYNSSMHLLNVIEDALDMSRIENKKFSILLEFMDIREAVKEVSEIMRFQVESKKLKLDILIEDNASCLCLYKPLQKASFAHLLVIFSRLNTAPCVSLLVNSTILTLLTSHQALMCVFFWSRKINQ